MTSFVPSGWRKPWCLRPPPSSFLRRNMGPHVSREWFVRLPFISGIQVFTVTRIPPIGFETLEPETSSDDDYDYNYDYEADGVSDIEHWLANDGHDVDMA